MWPLWEIWRMGQHWKRFQSINCEEMEPQLCNCFLHFWRKQRAHLVQLHYITIFKGCVKLGLFNHTLTALWLFTFTICIHKILLRVNFQLWHVCESVWEKWRRWNRGFCQIWKVLKEIWDLRWRRSRSAFCRIASSQIYRDAPPPPPLPMHHQCTMCYAMSIDILAVFKSKKSLHAHFILKSIHSFLDDAKLPKSTHCGTVWRAR